jgi:regulator of sigma E protease
VDFSLIAATGDASLGAWLVGVFWTILTMALGLGFVIFVHELGHFLVAKAMGVKCEKFYVGFDFFEVKLGPIKIPRALWKMKWGETEYGIGILPLGGYVKMLGQDDDPRNAAKEAERTRLKDESATATDTSDVHPFNPDDIRTSELAKGTSAEGLKEGHTVERPVKLDPRSYPAKSVPARMAIISAGVIMNLIFAVVFAAVAYKLGVQEMPAIIGGTLPGDPAWKAGLGPGDQILQIGRSGQPYEHLRFQDVTRGVVFNGADRDLSLLVRHPNGEEKWYDIRPTERLKSKTNFPSLGITSYHTDQLIVSAEAPEFLRPKTSVPLQLKDTVVAVNGQKIRAASEIDALLARNASEPITLTIERSAPPESAKASAEADKPAEKKTLDVVVQPLAMRETGIAMEIGPIVAVRDGSPAKEAGFQPGDVITSVDGEPIGDPLSLPQRLASKAGETVEFTVSRKDREGKPTEKTISVAYPAPDTFFNEYHMGGPVGFNALGIAYDVTNKVANVAPGSPADKGGIEPGDKVSAVTFLPQGEAATKHWDLLAEDLKLKTPTVVLEAPIDTWTRMHWLMQNVHPDTKVELKFSRGGKEQSAALALQPSQTYFDESRNLKFMSLRFEHVAGTWSEAIGLGVRETREKIGEVLGVLSRLLTGRISATNLSGPLGIGRAAYDHATLGTPMLLLFLTMLSANLAVLNFLPIPALDGGHMVFLAAEGIRGKPVDEQLQVRLTIAGVLCLLSLMVFATAMDFGRFFS